jgi:hypothetical protein
MFSAIFQTPPEPVIFKPANEVSEHFKLPVLQGKRF